MKKDGEQGSLLESVFRSDVVVEVELVGMRADAQGVVFGALHLDVIVEEVLGEDVALARI